MTGLQIKITRMALLAVCSAALTAPLAVLAQDTPPPPPASAPDAGGPGGPGGGRPSPQEREAKQLEELTKHLSLTADQQTQVKQIFADRDVKVMALHSDSSVAPQDKRAKMMGIMKDSSASIRAILTPDQQTKYDAMMAHRQQEMQEHHEHGGPGGPPSGDGSGGAPPPPPQQ